MIARKEPLINLSFFPDDAGTLKNRLNYAHIFGVFAFFAPFHLPNTRYPRILGALPLGRQVFFPDE
jgi:hypothetical protein